ncbi:hypothetical protein EF879_04510 [Micromonospora sp. HM5-17]|nr:hypothetical protein EF879_04510 [Micromonospora sp. HM5-17]
MWSTGTHPSGRPSVRPVGVGPLDRTSLTDAFEAGCLIRCTRTVSVRQPASLLAEFSSAAAAARLAELLSRFGPPPRPERVVAGVRRRYELHRLHAVDSGQSALLVGGWRQGRSVLLDPSVAGATAPRHALRHDLAAAAWRAALLAAGRYVRTTILGVRITDTELAAVLVRGAHLLGSTATVARRSGCLLVTVPGGADRERILRHGVRPASLAS